MNQKAVIELLQPLQDKRGIAHFKALELPNLTSFGIGLTKLKKLAPKIGKRNHELALDLWKSNIYELKLLAIIIDDPKKVGREQIHEQITFVSNWIFSHAYCSILMAKHPEQQAIAEDWLQSTNDLLRRCGYLCLYNLAKDDKKLSDSYFEPHILHIEHHLQKEENFVKDAMNNALWAIGKRSKNLNEKAQKAAMSIGKVEVDYGDNSCEAIDVMKHLTNPRLLEKLT